MTLLLYIIVSALSTVVLGSVLYLWLGNLHQRWHARKRERLMKNYLKSLYTWAYQDHIDRSNFSRLVNGGSRKIEAELVAKMALLTYGHINMRMEKLIQWRHIDRMLLRRASMTQGYTRAKYLKLLSQLPVNEHTAQRIRAFEDDPNRYVRLFALLAQINYAPDKLIEIISTHHHRHRMGDLEFSQITLLIRRRFVPVSVYKELIDSFDRNSILLGLYLIRVFQIDDAAPAIARLIPTPDKILRNAVLHTLVASRSPLTQRRVVTTVSLIGERGRKRFYRLVAGEGYSMNALRPIIGMERTDRLRAYLCHAVDGRKRKLNTIPQEND